MKQAKPRELPWSWERSPSWRGQLERMKRWRQRLESLRGSGDLDHAFDVALAFFINCYHLRDWLHRSGGVESSDIDTLFASSLHLRIAADIANIAKHFDLTQPPRMTRQLSMAREYVGPGEGWFGSDSALRVQSDGATYDLAELAGECEEAWRGFLSGRGLI